MDVILIKSFDFDKPHPQFVQTFDVLKKYKMELNPSYCAFKITSGKFFRFMAISWRIEKNIK